MIKLLKKIPRVELLGLSCTLIMAAWFYHVFQNANKHPGIFFEKLKPAILRTLGGHNNILARLIFRDRKNEQYIAKKYD